MSNKYFSGRKGQYIFCDICGQACYTSQIIKLAAFSGRPGLLVCPRDADAIDHGLIPYALPVERGVNMSRTNHQDVTNGAAPEDTETSTRLGA